MQATQAQSVLINPSKAEIRLGATSVDAGNALLAQCGSFSLCAASLQQHASQSCILPLQLVSAPCFSLCACRSYCICAAAAMTL